MTDVMASLFVDVHPSRAKLTLFRDGNCFLMAYTVSAYSLQQMVLRDVVDGSTRSSRNAIYDRRSSRFDIAFHAMWAETNPTSATTLLSDRNTRVFRTALLALTEPRTLWRRNTRYTSRCTHTSCTFWWRIRTIRTTHVLHSSQWLQLCWSRLHNAWLLWECCWCGWKS